MPSVSVLYYLAKVIIDDKIEWFIFSHIVGDRHKDEVEERFSRRDEAEKWFLYNNIREYKIY